MSIIVPIYNVERYINRCLDSLVKQTYYNVEIICIDDGSTDAGGRIAEEYVKRDARVSLITQQNAGQGVARNAGLSVARGTYIMFCDGDDYYALDMCEKMVRAMEHEPEAAYAVCGIEVTYECHHHLARADANYFRIKYAGKVRLTEEIILNTDVSPCNKIFRKALIDAYQLSFPKGLKYEDSYFYHIYSIFSSYAIYIPDKLYYYVRRSGSTMSLTYGGNSNYVTDHLAIAACIYDKLKRDKRIAAHVHYFGEVFFKLLESAISSCRLEEKETIFNYAEDFLRNEYIDFSRYADLAYRLYLLKHHRAIGSEKTKWWGLWRIKQKPTCVKYYFCGICLWKTSAMKA